MRCCTGAAPHSVCQPSTALPDPAIKLVAQNADLGKIQSLGAASWRQAPPALAWAVASQSPAGSQRLDEPCLTNTQTVSSSSLCLLS